MNAQDIMTTPVVTIAPETPVPGIAALLVERRISGVPVIDRGRVAGIVSEGDLLRRHEIGTARQPSRGPWWSRLLEDLAEPAEYVKSHALHAADVMSTDVIRVAEETPVARIAALFERHRIKRVPVMRGATLVGIVTRADLVRAIAAASAKAPRAVAQADDRIRAHLLQELAGQKWWRGNANVTVDGGTVHFWGAYDSEDARRASRVAAETIPGVRRIDDHRINGGDRPIMG